MLNLAARLLKRDCYGWTEDSGVWSPCLPLWRWTCPCLPLWRRTCPCLPLWRWACPCLPLWRRTCPCLPLWRRTCPCLPLWRRTCPCLPLWRRTCPCLPLWRGTTREARRQPLIKEAGHCGTSLAVVETSACWMCTIVVDWNLQTTFITRVLNVIKLFWICTSNVSIYVISRGRPLLLGCFYVLFVCFDAFGPVSCLLGQKELSDNRMVGQIKSAHPGTNDFHNLKGTISSSCDWRCWFTISTCGVSFHCRSDWRLERVVTYKPPLSYRPVKTKGLGLYRVSKVLIRRWSGRWSDQVTGPRCVLLSLVHLSAHTPVAWWGQGLAQNCITARGSEPLTCTSVCWHSSCLVGPGTGSKLYYSSWIQTPDLFGHFRSGQLGHVSTLNFLQCHGSFLGTALRQVAQIGVPAKVVFQSLWPWITRPSVGSEFSRSHCWVQSFLCSAYSTRRLCQCQSGWLSCIHYGQIRPVLSLSLSLSLPPLPPPSLSPSVCFCLSVSLSLCLSVCLSVCLSMSVSVSLSLPLPPPPPPPSLSACSLSFKQRKQMAEGLVQGLAVTRR